MTLSLLRTYDYTTAPATAANAAAGSFLLPHQKDVQGGVASINGGQLRLANEGSLSFFRDFLDYDDIAPMTDQKIVTRYIQAGDGTSMGVILRWDRTTKCGYFCDSQGTGFENYKTVGTPTANSYQNFTGATQTPAVVNGHVYQMVVQVIGNVVSGCTFDITAPAQGQPADPQNVTDTGALTPFTFTDASSPYASGNAIPVASYGGATHYQTVRIYGNAFSAAPISLVAGQAGQTLTLTGAGWTPGTPGSPTFTGTFAASGGGTATAIASQSVTDTGHATLTMTVGTAQGTLTVTDPVSGLTTAVGLTSPPTLVPNAILAGAISPTSIAFTAQAPTAGTPPYSYQWYRDSAPITAAPAAIPAGKALSGQTALALTDAAPLAAPATNFYALIATDSGGQVVKSTVAAVVKAPPLVVLRIGDSLGARQPTGGGPLSVDYEATYLSQFNGQNRLVTIINRSSSGTATDSWLPTETTSETTPGNVNTNLFNTAVAAAQAAGATVAEIALGTNDSKGGSPASRLANFQAIIAGLKAAAFTKIVLHQPPFYQTYAGQGQFTESGQALIVQYQTQVFPLLVDNVTVFLGDTSLYAMTLGDQTLQDDGIHYSQKGVNVAGRAWAEAMGRVLGFLPASVASTLRSRGSRPATKGGH